MHPYLLHLDLYSQSYEGLKLSRATRTDSALGCRTAEMKIGQKPRSDRKPRSDSDHRDSDSDGRIRAVTHPYNTQSQHAYTLHTAQKLARTVYDKNETRDTQPLGAAPAPAPDLGKNTDRLYIRRFGPWRNNSMRYRNGPQVAPRLPVYGAKAARLRRQGCQSSAPRCRTSLRLGYQ